MKDIIHYFTRAGHTARVVKGTIHVTKESGVQWLGLTIAGVMIQERIKLKVQYNKPKSKKMGGIVDVTISKLL
jgi:hypothetical protein